MMKTELFKELEFRPTNPQGGEYANIAQIADFVHEGQRYFVKRNFRLGTAPLEAWALNWLRGQGLHVAEPVMANEQYIVTKEVKGEELLPENGRTPDIVVAFVRDVFDPAMEKMWREVPWTYQYGVPVVQRDCKLEHFRKTESGLAVVDAVAIDPREELGFLPKVVY